MSRFDEAIAEMKRHAEAKRNQEEYLEKLNKITNKIRANATHDEIRSWRMIDSIICSNSKLSDVNEEHIRDLLKGE